jgi:hypothetical protein
MKDYPDTFFMKPALGSSAMAIPIQQRSAMKVMIRDFYGFNLSQNEDE